MHNTFNNIRALRLGLEARPRNPSVSTETIPKFGQYDAQAPTVQDSCAADVLKTSSP